MVKGLILLVKDINLLVKGLILLVKDCIKYLAIVVVVWTVFVVYEYCVIVTFLFPFPSAAVDAVPVEGFYPSWTQCATENPLNKLTNASDDAALNETIQSCSYEKLNTDTVLKVSWDGSAALINCTLCCMRWYLTIDNMECSDPGPIDAAYVQDLSDTVISAENNLHRPTTVAGICNQAGGAPLEAGDRLVELHVGLCQDTQGTGTVPEPSSTITGYNSVSRIVIEEIPAIPDSESACPATLVDPRR